MGRVYKIVDTAIVVVCIPFYVVLVPVVLLEQWFRQRRRLRIGLEVTHWPACDVREDYLVVDVTRIDQQVVGIRRRKWGLLGGTEQPPYDEPVEFIPVSRFWVPEPFRIRGAKSA